MNPWGQKIHKNSRTHRTLIEPGRSIDVTGTMRLTSPRRLTGVLSANRLTGAIGI
jgi:hypothetical protein